MKTKPVALVTGASSGIGAACAVRLARSGRHVVGVSRSGTIGGRSPEEFDGLSLEALRLDIRDPAAIQAAVNGIVERRGRLDSVVNAAGIAVAGSVEDTPIEFVREQLETNLLGAIYLTRAVVPLLRRAAPSSLVHISSIAGQVALPYQSIYCAGKFALEGFCESVRYELERDGIRIHVIRPGSVRTGLTTNRQTASAGAAHSTWAGKALSINDADELKGVDPDDVARIVEKTLHSVSSRRQWSVGHWHERVALPVRAVLPGEWFRRFVGAHYGIRKV